jgi:hypothetical protein
MLTQLAVQVTDRAINRKEEGKKRRGHAQAGQHYW